MADLTQSLYEVEDQLKQRGFLARMVKAANEPRDADADVGTNPNPWGLSWLCNLSRFAQKMVVDCSGTVATGGAGVGVESGTATAVPAAVGAGVGFVRKLRDENRVFDQERVQALEREDQDCGAELAGDPSVS